MHFKNSKKIGLNTKYLCQCHRLCRSAKQAQATHFYLSSMSFTYPHYIQI